MIATGCIMARICHTNNCPVGVASQREELRARFPGVPGDLVNFFLYVAEEVSSLILTRSPVEEAGDHCRVLGRPVNRRTVPPCARCAHCVGSAGLMQT
jgi:hypothetical protein